MYSTLSNLAMTNLHLFEWMSIARVDFQKIVPRVKSLSWFGPIPPFFLLKLPFFMVKSPFFYGEISIFAACKHLHVWSTPLDPCPVPSDTESRDSSLVAPGARLLGLVQGGIPVPGVRFFRSAEIFFFGQSGKARRFFTGLPSGELT